MNINLHRNRVGEATIAAGLLLGAFALAGSPVSAGVDNQIGQPQPAAALPDAHPGPGIAFANGEEQEQERYDAERRAALILRAEASDRHLQTLADAAEQRARELQAEGSDQHLENLAEQGEDNTSGAPLCDSRPGHSTRHCAE